MHEAETANLQPKPFYRRHWHVILLGLIALLAFGLDFFAIDKVGFGNGYYAAAIRSMTESFHNFFFVSFDPAGVVTVDKPPLGLWVQALFCLVFGYHGWAMLLPQALAATGSCIMMYVIVSKYFEKPAGLISALVFALTPAVVVAARNNTMDMQLIFVLLVSVWFLFRSIDTGKWRFLFLCAVFIGLGFNVKMLQAYMILPAVVIVYLVFAKEKFPKRLLAGFISLLIMAVVSFAWVAAVDLTPSTDRPYVGSSTDNTELELIIGHNGMERIYGGGGNRMGPAGNSNRTGQNRPSGQTGGAPSDGGTRTNRSQTGQAGTAQSGSRAQNGQTAANSQSGQFPGGGIPGGQGSFNGGQWPDGSGQGSFPGGFTGGGTGSFPGGTDGNQFRGQGGGQLGGGMGGAGNDIGNAGALRLWGNTLYGQASWLIVLALFCILVKVKKFSFKKLTVHEGMFLFWIIWLVTMYVFFSFASFWHRYYLCMFAPGIAGLVGIGIPAMVRAFREKDSWRQFVLPVALLGTFAVEILFVWSYTQLRTWLVPVMIVTGAAALILMVLHMCKPKKLLAQLAAWLMMLSLLAAPFYWALTVVLYLEQNSTLPYAGPELASTAAVPGMTRNQEVLTAADSGTNSLENYLVAHYKEGTYLVVAQRANDVAQFIVDTGLPAVAYGGFLGSDSAITLDQLKQLVSEGKVTYFLVTNQGGNSSIESWVKQNATLIPTSEYLGTSSGRTGAASSNGISGDALYLFE